MSNDWREVLTEWEAAELEVIERDQRNYRSHLQVLSHDKRAIMNRAIQRKKYRSHPKKGVDMDASIP